MDHIFDPTRPVYIIGDPTIDQNLLQPIQHIAIDEAMRPALYTDIALFSNAGFYQRFSFWRFRRHTEDGTIYTTYAECASDPRVDPRIKQVSLPGSTTAAKSVSLAAELGAKNVVLVLGKKLTESQANEIQQIAESLGVKVLIADSPPDPEIFNEQALFGGPFFMAESQPSPKKQKKEK
jgi:hypothetical protein